MKYIDADKLKVKLDEHYRNYQSKYMETRNPYTQGLIDALDLAEQVIDSLQQERQNDVCAEIKDYYGEDLAFEEERGKHITDLLNNFEKGMKAGYEKAISEFQEVKLECSPVMKEFISKLFEIGNATNFGFGPMKLQQEQPHWKPSDEQMDRLVSIVAALRKDSCDDMADFLAEIYHGLEKL